MLQTVSSDFIPIYMDCGWTRKTKEFYTSGNIKQLHWVKLFGVLLFNQVKSKTCFLVYDNYKCLELENGRILLNWSIVNKKNNEKL